MGKRPLYQVHHIKGYDLARHCPHNGHAGLWYDKFCDQWNEDWSMSGEDSRKLQWIKEVTGLWPRNDKMLKEAVQRRKELIKQLRGREFSLKTSGPFVTGLGREHPIENGFAWHHSLGVPYLPGSSLKGLVRTWAENWTDSVSSLEDRIFGPRDNILNEDKREAQVGSVIFFDALLSEQVTLRADVMTPHYPQYYQESKLPGDWLSPVPIPFLTVDTNATFQFCVAARCSEDTLMREDCAIVEEWLVHALEWLGAGAKTAVGYGRFDKT